MSEARLLVGIVAAVAGDVVTVTVLGTGTVKCRATGVVEVGQQVDVLQAGSSWLAIAGGGEPPDLSAYATELYVDDRERTYTTESTAVSWNNVTVPGTHPRLMHGVNNATGTGVATYYYLTNYVHAGTEGVALAEGHTNNLTQWAIPYGNSTTASPYLRHRYNSSWGAWKEATVNALRLTGGSLSGGLDLGSGVASSATNLDRHLALYGTTYGFSVTSGAMNFNSAGAYTVYYSGGAGQTLQKTGIMYTGTTYPGGGNNRIGFRWVGTSIVGSVDNVNAITCGTASNRRYKAAITGLRGALAKVKRLRPVEYTARGLDSSPTYDRHIGLVADEVARVLPSAVVPNFEGKPESVNYLEVVPLLVAAIQELSAEVEALKARAA